MEYASLLSFAHEAVDLAVELVRRRQPGAVTEKQDRDLVSEVDVAVERAVREYLSEATPDIGVLGEEEGHTGDAEVFWAVDPIDGTANFVHGLPLCGVSLGLIERGRSVLGVIELPFLGMRYHAAAGEGAYRGDTRIRCRETNVLSDAIVAINDYAVGQDADVKNRARLALTEALVPKVQRIRMLGSTAVHLAWLADGLVDAMILLSNQPWDTAAGVIIAREAGAVVMDAHGEPHTADSDSVVASTPSLVGEVVDLVRSVR